MIAIFFNVIAVIVGSAIGALAKRGISEKYITVLNTAMGLAALVLGINVAMSNMAKSQLPVLFRGNHHCGALLLRRNPLYDGTRAGSPQR